jgi:hypothetical protein
MKGGRLYKAKSKQNKTVEAQSLKSRAKIPHQSPKRKITADIYRQITQDMWDNAVKNGANYCFFCGEKMTKREDNHHLKGRDGFLFIDPDWLVLAHNDCHFWKYHKLSIEVLSKLPWWNSFLTRLQAKSEELYQLEMKKFEKAKPVNRLNPLKSKYQEEELF